MKDKSDRQRKFLGFFVSQNEFARIQSVYAETACRSVSEYLRKISLQKPVVVITRNQTAENVMLEMIEIKNALNNGIKNLNPDNDSTKQSVITLFETICLRMDQIYELCSRK
jgi:hypothetical protein